MGLVLWETFSTLTNRQTAFSAGKISRIAVHHFSRPPFVSILHCVIFLLFFEWPVWAALQLEGRKHDQMLPMGSGIACRAFFYLFTREGVQSISPLETSAPVFPSHVDHHDLQVLD